MRGGGSTARRVAVLLMLCCCARCFAVAAGRLSRAAPAGSQSKDACGNGGEATCDRPPNLTHIPAAADLLPPTRKATNCGPLVPHLA